MTDKRKSLRDELKEIIANATGNSPNIASSINVGDGDQHTSVSKKQRVVQRDGVTTKVTETREERRDG